MIKVPLYNDIAQNDVDFATFKALRANLSDYAGANLTWNSGTNKFDAAPGGGGSIGTVLGKRVSVKDAPYNATGLGVADDTVAIQTAINDVCAAGGGTVFFPHGIYLCNGAFDATFHSILVIPFTNSNPITLQLLGEEMPAWSAAGAATNYLNVSTIKTTRTDGMTADTNGFAAIISGNGPFGNALHSAFSDMSAVMVRIKNMQFLCPSNPTMGGIRLDGIGNAFVEDVSVNVADASVEPMHGTTAVWMPNAINWSINWMLHVNVAGFDTGFKTGEHLRAPMIQAYNCKNGVTFLESQYPSWANIQLGACVNGITFLGPHIVDLLLETEHAPGGSGWLTVSHDISDHSNYGNGVIRYFIGHGTPSNPDIAPAVDGGTGLTLIGLFSGQITMNTSQGVAGAGASTLTGQIFATNQLLVGYTDTGLIRSNTSELTATNGSTGLATFKAGTVYIGTDARLVPITGGFKIQARNPGTNTWVDADSWTNP